MPVRALLPGALEQAAQAVSHAAAGWAPCWEPSFHRSIMQHTAECFCIHPITSTVEGIVLLYVTALPGVVKRQV